MLSAKLANLLQYFTFPVELVGFSLALIEIRFPHFASRLSHLIVKSADEPTQPLKSEVPLSKALVTIGLFLMIGLIIVLFSLPQWVVYGGGGVLFAFGVGHAIAARWVPNRAVGTVGLIMAGLGLVAELYQLMVLICS